MADFVYGREQVSGHWNLKPSQLRNALRALYPAETIEVCTDGAVVTVEVDGSGPVGFSLAANDEVSTIKAGFVPGNVVASTPDVVTAVAEAHTVESHSGTSATGAELTELTDGSETTLHSHAGDGGGSVWGQHYQYSEDDTFRTNLTSTYAQAHRLTTGTLTAGTYRVEWFYKWSRDNNQTDFVCKVEIDDTTNLYAEDAPTPVDAHRQEAKDSAGTGSGGTDQRHIASAFADVVLTADTHTIDIDFYSSDNTASANVHITRISIYRVA